MTRPSGVDDEEQIAFLGSTGILRMTGALRLAFRGQEGETRLESGLLWARPGDLFMIVTLGELIMRNPTSSSSVSSSPST